MCPLKSLFSVLSHIRRRFLNLPQWFLFFSHFSASRSNSTVSLQDNQFNIKANKESLDACHAYKKHCPLSSEKKKTSNRVFLGCQTYERLFTCKAKAVSLPANHRFGKEKPNSPHYLSDSYHPGYFPNHSVRQQDVLPAH